MASALSSLRYSKGVPFSYNATSTFWQYEENGWAYNASDKG
jgi:hypothetical protein